jgi:serine/threonine-protein kinase
VAVAYQHVREDPVPPSQVEPEVPAAVDAIVLKAMAKNPANRYQSAADLRADIERALAGRPVEATPVLAEDATAMMPPPATTVLLRQQQPRTGRAAAYALLALATMAVFVIALLVARGLLSNGSGEVNTPNVTGQTLADAQDILAGKGLSVGHVTTAYSPKVAKNVVISQDPKADILLKKGDSVDLVVSLGVQLVTVPDQLVGLTQDEATTALKAAGLKVGDVVPQNSDVPAGQVLATDPAAGSSVPIGSKVTLTVSNGQVKVPNVVGKDLATAEGILEQHGFTVLEQPAAEYDKHQPENTVVGQTPVAGTYAQTGPDHPVTVYFNQKPTPSPSPSPSESASPTASESPSPTPSASSSPSPTGSPTP